MEYLSCSVNIGVKSVNDSVKFYQEVLGFNLVMSMPPESGNFVWAMVQGGGVVMMFQQEESLKEEYPFLADKPLNACLNFYIKMKGMAELYEKIKDTKYLAQERHVTPYGADEFAMYDNNGYVITITEDK
jgi:Lactoylglutathione lyase and related lyases